MNCHKTMSLPCIVYKRKLLSFMEIMFLKNYMTEKQQYMMLRPDGKNGVVGIRHVTRDTAHR